MYWIIHRTNGIDHFKTEAKFKDFVEPKSEESNWHSGPSRDRSDNQLFNDSMEVDNLDDRQSIHK